MEHDVVGGDVRWVEQAVFGAALVTVVVWAVGVPLLYASLLYAARESLGQSRDLNLSSPLLSSPLLKLPS